MPDLRPPSVLMLTCQFLPEVFGGAEQQCLRLSRALLELGLRPHILSSKCRPETPAEEIMDGVPVTRLASAHPPQQGGRHIWSSLSWMHAVETWAHRNRTAIDIVHCHQAKLNAWAGVRIARRLKVPSVVKLGSAGPNLDFYSLQRKKWLWGALAARTITREASMIVAISQEMLQDVSAYGVPSDRRVMIPNGVVSWKKPASESTATRARIRKRLRLDLGAPLLLFVGRMERQKNVDTLLQAFAGLPERLDGVHLALLGDGALLAAHRRLARELGIAQKTHFVGRTDSVQDYLSAADLFVLPAVAEGMSNALLEALAAGVPQIVSRVSGSADVVVEGETGWLYGQPSDLEALKASVTAALDLPRDRLAAMAAASRTRAEESFSVDAVARRYVSLYDTLMAERV